MSLSLSDVPLNLGQEFARAVAAPRAIFEQGVPRFVGDAWEFVSGYVANAAGSVLPAIPPVQMRVIEVAAVAAGCWMTLLVITGLAERLTSRRGRVDVRLSPGPR